MSYKNLNVFFVCDQHSVSDIKRWLEYSQEQLLISPFFLDSSDITAKSFLEFINIIKVDFLFVSYQEELVSIFNLDIYSKLHLNNKDFFLSWIIKKDSLESEKMIELIKMGADDLIINDKDERFLKWKVFSILRRKWDSHNKNNTIYAGPLILDCLKYVLYNNNIKIKLTKKEACLMKVLIQNYNYNQNSFLKRCEIYKRVWKVEFRDETRVFDQVFNRLTHKIGKDFFIIKKFEGIKLNIDLKNKVV
ncbi:MAG: winged helix-turn-helix domain-containing protein [Metamycoplasmataceae bacterium]